MSDKPSIDDCILVASIYVHKYLIVLSCHSVHWHLYSTKTLGFVCLAFSQAMTNFTATIIGYIENYYVSGSHAATLFWSIKYVPYFMRNMGGMRGEWGMRQEYWDKYRTRETQIICSSGFIVLLFYLLEILSFLDTYLQQKKYAIWGT